MKYVPTAQPITKNRNDSAISRENALSLERWSPGGRDAEFFPNIMRKD